MSRLLLSFHKRLAVGGGIALLGLQFAWHGLILPASAISPWLLAVIFSLPIIPGLLLALLHRPSGIFWLGVASLLYFSLGVAEAWAVPQARIVGLVQAGLACWVIITGSWDGMKARFARGKPPQANV